MHQGLGLGEHLFEGCRYGLDQRRLKGLIVWALADNTMATDFYWRRGGRPVKQAIENIGSRKLERSPSPGQPELAQPELVSAPFPRSPPEGLILNHIGLALPHPGTVGSAGHVPCRAIVSASFRASTIASTLASAST